MAGISKKSLYGVMATYYIYKHEDECVVKSAEISDTLKIPKNYLEQILLLLKKNDILKSTRGANGGYQLKKDSEDISILQIIEVLDGGFFEIQIEEKKCVLSNFWQDMTKDIRKVLNVPISKLDDYNVNEYFGCCEV